MKSIFLEEGLHLRYAHLRYYEDIEVVRLSKTPGSEIIFALCFMLPPASQKSLDHIFSYSPQTNYPRNVFLTSNDNRLSARIPEGLLSHTLELQFSREWLYTHLAGMEEKITSIVDKLGGENPVSVIAETTQASEDRLLSEITFELYKPLFNLLAVRSRALMLLANIICRIPGAPLPSSPDAPFVEPIPLGEQQLVQSREDMLPSRKELEKEFALSEWTTKK
ncbi:hypothetical protein Q4E93_11790 [Flavitalea sp. BT771]|uniref:hypothetical protein n=1 Tax=Flavitalea sp. BT771 TaxID=3063329 RepID=UPI0026E16AED|nr:hypothetical protein [Flavitalea sp. BT771]MDO6431274.1 hypothetical protein [Flavitalea sp. BT771]MDV6220182.1 hypothetical protein [Flavitalea sp. BT771]